MSSPSSLPQAMARSPSLPTRPCARRIRYWPGCSRLLPLARRPLARPTNALGPARLAPAPRGFAAPVAIRIVLEPDDRPVSKGKLCAQDHGFNLHAATRVAANDQQGRLTLCKYILRPPLANDRLKILDDGNVRLEFKKPWSDGTACVDLAPLAFIARLAALVPPPKRHLTRYFGVLSSHAAARSDVVPAPAVPAPAPAESDKPASKSKYIAWAELLRKTFGFEVICSKCHSQLRLIALIKAEAVAQKILKAMHLPTVIPALHPARPPRPPPGDTGGGDDWLN
jgi:hypothetical protein